MIIQDNIRIRYIYSACVVTSTRDISILHDPWFTDGIYDGSWYQYPKIENPIEDIGNVDYVYVSHIHPDHYDSIFLKKYFKRFGEKKIIIADHCPNHLAVKMKADGFQPIVLSKKLEIGKTSIEIVPHKTGSPSDIDSAIIIKYKSFSKKIHCIVNVNDIIIENNMLNDLKTKAKKIDILLCGFTGAGPYPQTYFDILDKNLLVEANKKKQEFFQRYKYLINQIKAKKNIPFAGKYILGGKLWILNNYRGVADPVEVLEFDKNAVVLSDNGGSIDTSTFIPSKIRTKKYDEHEILKRISQIKLKKMDYENLIPKGKIRKLPIKRLLYTSYRNAIKRSECSEDYFFCIYLPNNEIAVINANKNKINSLNFSNKLDKLPLPRSEILIDPRYLFGLLTNIYHWNNAQVGSQYMTRRYPNILNKKAQNFLNYLTV